METEGVTEKSTDIISGYDTATKEQLHEMLGEWRKIQKRQYNEVEKEVQKILLAIRKLKPKTCASCYKSLGEVGFYKNNLRKDGLQAYCINCMKEKQFRAKNRVEADLLEN